MPSDNGHGFFAARFRSFRFAARGVLLLFRSQSNARIHALAAFLVCAAGFYFGFSTAEWSWVILAIVLVLAAEAFNTALEFLTDLASPRPHPLARKAKDVAAGAVLITAVGAVILGFLIIGPYLV